MFLLLVLTMISGILASCSSDSSPQPSLIYEFNSKAGTVTPVDGDTTGTKFQLTFSNVTNVNWFSDRPIRNAGVDTVGNLVTGTWPNAYGSVVPNAVLEAFYGTRQYIQIFCTLEKPSYDAATGQLSFSITVNYVEGNQGALSNLSLADLQLIILNNAATSTAQWSELLYGDSLTFEKAAAANTYTLNVTNPFENVYSYTSAPVRNWLKTPVKDYLSSWQARFGTNPPNVAIMSTGKNNEVVIQIVTLRSPVYNESYRSISFTATPVYGAINAGEVLSDVELFIDASAGSYSEADLKKLNDTGSCVNCNLSGVDLSKKSLPKADLSGANLKEANLAYTNLKEANLAGADLTGATVENANLVGAALASITGPTGMPGRTINLVNNCSTDIWAAASGNTMAKKCRSSAECNGGTCPPLTVDCKTKLDCYNLCTKYPCTSNAQCSEPNTFCGGIPSYEPSADCKKDADCGANFTCNKDTGKCICKDDSACGGNFTCKTGSGQCGWKNCTYVPIPVEKAQIVDTPASCTSNKDCSSSQFCFTTTSTTGKCAQLPDATKGNSWQLNPGGTTPLFVPTPWAGRFWPRTGCVNGGSKCDPLFAGTDAQCGATAVNPSDRKLVQPPSSPVPYPVKCRSNNDCIQAPDNKAIVGGVCNLADTIAFDSVADHTKSQCTPGDDKTCDKLGVNYVCKEEEISVKGEPKPVKIGVCGYRQCSAYKCTGTDQNLCFPATFSCDTGTCYNDQSPSPQLTRNCRQSGLNSPTLAELNMFSPSKGIDFYDISLVDGANVPVQISPVTRTYAMGINDAVRSDMTCASDADCWKLDNTGKHTLEANWVCDTVKKYCVNKFYCGSPGCVSDCSTYGNNRTDPSTWGGRNLAIAEADCPEVLKLKKDGTTYIGCLSPTDACSPAHKNDPWRKDSDANKLNLFCDGNPKEVAGSKIVYTDLYKCIGAYATSSYQTGATTDNSCGCPDWMPKEFCAVGTNSNPKWVESALPFYKPFHNASPNSYTFPYDDLSGTFTCKGVNDATQVNYNITFCPK